MPLNQPVKVFTDGEIVENIYVIRGQKVMLDRDLAEMYNVATGRLNEQVRRNIQRFPEDFMFQLTHEEYNSLRSQIAILKKGRGKHVKFLPLAFTEKGVAMLSSVLRSEVAIQVNIQIIRVYTKMKQALLDNKELWRKVEKIEQAILKKDEEVQAIFKLLKTLLVKEEKPRQIIGFKVSSKK